MSKTKELAEALAYEPPKLKSLTEIDEITREALTHLKDRMILTRETAAAEVLKGVVSMGKKGDTLVIRKPVPYKPR